MDVRLRTVLALLFRGTGVYCGVRGVVAGARALTRRGVDVKREGAGADVSSLLWTCTSCCDGLG